MSETFTVVNSTPDMVEQLEAVQRASFPTLAKDEIITVEHYAAHIERFPEGQLVVLIQIYLSMEYAHLQPGHGKVSA